MENIDDGTILTQQKPASWSGCQDYMRISLWQGFDEARGLASGFRGGRAEAEQFGSLIQVLGQIGFTRRPRVAQSRIEFLECRAQGTVLLRLRGFGKFLEDFVAEITRCSRFQFLVLRLRFRIVVLQKVLDRCLDCRRAADVE